jgi:Domain of unknown function (DUF397)
MMGDNSSALWRDAEFRKSSFSGANDDNCVEVARGEALFGIRDSKNVAGPVLMLAEARGRAFLAAVKRL